MQTSALETVKDAYVKWADELETELIRRTGKNMDYFQDYPDLDVFIFEQLTPTETCNRIIETRGVRVIDYRES